MKFSASVLICLSISACASRSVMPTAKDVKVSGDEPSAKCRAIGKLTGATMTIKGTNEQALEDLRQEAANKGANYVVVKEYSGYGTAVTGLAYDCP